MKRSQAPSSVVSENKRKKFVPPFTASPSAPHHGVRNHSYQELGPNVGVIYITTVHSA